MHKYSPKHPLNVRKESLSYSHNLKEWRQRLGAATNVEDIRSCLHDGFGVSVSSREEEQERFALYLEYADGHLDSRTFVPPWLHPSAWDLGNHVQTPLGKGWPANTFRIVAQKAFTMLCSSVFADDTKVNEYSVPGVTYQPSWMGLAERRPNLEKLCWFLRLDDDSFGCRCLRNLHAFSGYEDQVGRHYLETGRQFAYDLVRFILRCHTNRALLDEFVPVTVDILFGLRRLDLFLRDDYWPLADKRCLKRMEELALEAWVHAEDYRKVRNLGEALVAGSQAARVLMMLRALQREQKKLDRYISLHRQQKDAAAELQRLQ